MNARRDPDRLIHAFLMEGQTELADQVFDAVRTVTERKRQRVVIGPWRTPIMNKLVPIGLGAAAVVVALVIGTRLLGPAPGDPASSPTVEPSATAEPSVSAPSPSDSGTASPAASTPPLTQTFTSQMHGFSVSYPEGWTARAATEPWADATQGPVFTDPFSDILYDPVLGDHLHLRFASHPIGDSTPDAWVAEQMAGGGCTAAEPITVDGATGRIDDCDLVVVATAGRGYWIALGASDDDPVATAAYDRAWFEAVLATVQLQPEDAVDVAP
jgi:hypothetical protein